MNIRLEKSADETGLTVFVEGSIDTVTAPTLETELGRHCGGLKELVLDLTAVDYISSAGLRVIMTVDQQMTDTGRLVLRNVNPDVREVFEMTGFGELLNIE